MTVTCVSNRWLSTHSTLSVANTVEQGPDRTVRSNGPCAGWLNKQEDTRTWNAVCLSSATG